MMLLILILEKLIHNLMKRYLALQRIVSYGSFTKAAKSMNCTQSSISQMISSLEEELGIKLLNRSRNGVELTHEGKDIYPQIERYIKQYSAVLEQAEEINHLGKGTVTIGTLASITCHWMPELIMGFQKIYPKVNFVFKQGDYTSIEEWIKNGDVDFGFVTHPSVSDIELIDVKDGQMMAIVPEKHRLASKTSVNLNEMTDDPFILLETGTYSEPMEAFEKAGLTPNIKFRIHDDYTIMRMVENGMALSIVAELVLRRTHYAIRAIPLDPPLIRTVSIGYRDMDSIPAASKRFIRYILDNAEKLP